MADVVHIDAICPKTTNPAVRARRPKVARTDKLALTPEQVAAIYEAAGEPAVKVAVGLAANHGDAAGEVCGLEWATSTPKPGSSFSAVG